MHVGSKVAGAQNHWHQSVAPLMPMQAVAFHTTLAVGRILMFVGGDRGGGSPPAGGSGGWEPPKLAGGLGASAPQGRAQDGQARTTPYEFTEFGAVDVNKPYKYTWYWGHGPQGSLWKRRAGSDTLSGNVPDPGKF